MDASGRWQYWFQAGKHFRDSIDLVMTRNVMSVCQGRVTCDTCHFSRNIQTNDLQLARWLFHRYETSCPPESLFCEWKHGPCALRTVLVGPESTFEEVASKHSHDVGQVLLEHHDEPLPPINAAQVVKCGNYVALEMIRKAKGLNALRRVNVYRLARTGHPAALKFCFRCLDETCTISAANQAAAHGHLHVVEHLHKARREGCTAAGYSTVSSSDSIRRIRNKSDRRSSQARPRSR